MSTVDLASTTAAPVAVQAKAPRKRPKLAETWWRHIIGIVACLVALFPIWFVASASFDDSQSISTTGFFPTSWTLSNYGRLLHNQIPSAGGTGTIPEPFLRWFGNTLLVATVAALCTVIISAWAAYAFSRFRFRGRRMGMLALLLIQMFPTLLLVVAIYLIIFNVGAIFPVVSLNTYAALILVYLGGAMGVNTWLMKGYFDTIPKELDESARVDGATPAQIFWGVVLPLAMPILAVIALWSFIFAINEYVIASVIMQTPDHLTLPVGLRFLINGNYSTYWGYFAAAALMAAIPAVALFAWLQRYIVSGLAQGAVKG
jgi:arabinogalactan oligomer / maltooligosaccharide transport system permease protein